MCDRSRLAAEAARAAAKTKAGKPAERGSGEGWVGGVPAPKRTSRRLLSHLKAAEPGGGHPQKSRAKGEGPHG